MSDTESETGRQSTSVKGEHPSGSVARDFTRQTVDIARQTKDQYKFHEMCEGHPVLGAFIQSMQALQVLVASDQSATYKEATDFTGLDMLNGMLNDFASYLAGVGKAHLDAGRCHLTGCGVLQLVSRITQMLVLRPNMSKKRCATLCALLQAVENLIQDAQFFSRGIRQREVYFALVSVATLELSTAESALTFLEDSTASPAAKQEELEYHLYRADAVHVPLIARAEVEAALPKAAKAALQAKPVANTVAPTKLTAAQLKQINHTVDSAQAKHDQEVRADVASVAGRLSVVESDCAQTRSEISSLRSEVDTRLTKIESLLVEIAKK